MFSGRDILDNFRWVVRNYMNTKWCVIWLVVIYHFFMASMMIFRLCLLNMEQRFFSINSTCRGVAAVILKVHHLCIIQILFIFLMSCWRKAPTSSHLSESSKLPSLHQRCWNLFFFPMAFSSSVEMDGINYIKNDKWILIFLFDISNLI